MRIGRVADQRQLHRSRHLLKSLAHRNALFSGSMRLT